MLQHAKDMAANFGGGKKIKDCVLTVSTSFTQHMREMLFITTRRRRAQRARIRMGSNIFVLWHDCVSRRGRSKKFSLRTVGFLWEQSSSMRMDVDLRAKVSRSEFEEACSETSLLDSQSLLAEHWPWRISLLRRWAPWSYWVAAFECQKGNNNYSMSISNLLALR